MAVFWQQAALAASSQDPAERFERAEELRRNSEPEAALKELTRLREDYPDNVDYALARALVLAQLQQNEEALAEFDAAIELAPDYKDLYTLRARVVANQPEDGHSWTLLLGAGYEDLSDGLPSWATNCGDMRAPVPGPACGRPDSCKVRSMVSRRMHSAIG